MTEQHHAAAIVPAHDIGASTAGYGRLGFEVVSDHGDYRLLAENSGWRDPGGTLVRIGRVLG